jgi:hypothetical protein
MTQKRLAAIDHTFAQFEKKGKVLLEDLLGSLVIEKHPHVRSLSKKAERARLDVE